MTNRKVYTVYKTTNLTNGNYYFGVHKTSDPYDSYLGSGTYIFRAVAKYGKQNFRKDVLFIYLDRESAFGKEDELIQCYRELDPLCMNLRKGGAGGFDYINKFGLGSTSAVKEKIRRANLGRKHSEAAKLNMSEGQKRRLPPSQATREKLRIAHLGRKNFISAEGIQRIRQANTGRPAWNRGKKMPEDFGKHIADAKRGKKRPQHVGKAVGEANRRRTQVKWIYKDGQEKKVAVQQIDGMMEQGWRLGRPSIASLSLGGALRGTERRTGR